MLQKIGDREARRKARRERLLKLLQEQVWPLVLRAVLGKRVTRRERERILGYRFGSEER